jgi:RHS repeat-associated protein
VVDSASQTTTGVIDVNRLVKWGSDSLVYDADGNRSDKLSTSGNVHYEWTADGRLRSVTAGGVTTAYDYDAHGQLVRKSQGSTVVSHFLWDAGQLLAELDGSASTKVAEYVFAPGAVDVPLAVLVGTDPTLHYFEVDAANNVIGAFSGATGAVEQTLSYDPFGQVTGVSGSLTASRLRWKGLLWEDGAGFQFVRARWYDPATRRFVSEDPMGAAGGSSSPYAFAANDPVGGRDPSGLRRASDEACFMQRECWGEGGSPLGGGGFFMGRGPCTIMNGSCGDPLAGLPPRSTGRGSSSGSASEMTCHVGGSSERLQSCLSAAREFLAEAAPTFWVFNGTLTGPRLANGCPADQYRMLPGDLSNMPTLQHGARFERFELTIVHRLSLAGRTLEALASGAGLVSVPTASTGYVPVHVFATINCVTGSGEFTAVGTSP